MQSITFSDSFNGYPINTNEERGLGCFTKILSVYEQRLEYMLSTHSKVMQVRFDLRYPSDGSVVPDIKHIYRFNQYMQRGLKELKFQGGHKVDPCYVGVIEQDHSPFPHVHMVVLVNANAIEYPVTVWRMADLYWGLAIGSEQEGLVHYCLQHKNGIIARRDEDDYKDNINKIFYQASYLAKLRDKEERSIGSRMCLKNRI